MPFISTYFKWNENGAVITYKNKTTFLEKIKRTEEGIITTLRGGVSIKNQIENWIEIMNELAQNWDTILEANAVIADFYIGIVILKKLKVNLDIDYGWIFVKRRKIKSCKVCHTDTRLKCSGCHKAYYCCGSCQNADWKIHKKTCC